MTKAKLMKKIAKLESIQDLMITELQMLDAQLKRLGFEEGLLTMKAAANELVAIAERSDS